MPVTYDEYPDQRMVQLHVDGKVSAKELDRILPQLELFITKHPEGIKVLEIVENFGGAEWAAIRKGIRFDMENLQHFSHCAVVSNSGWIGPIARMAGMVLSCEIRSFPMQDLAAARTWLLAA